MICNGFARYQGQACTVFHAVQKGRVKVPILNHEAHRAFLQLGRVKAQPKGKGALAGAAVAGGDFLDGLEGGDAGPDAGHRQKAFGGQRKGIGAAVKTAFGAGGGGALWSGIVVPA